MTKRQLNSLIGLLVLFILDAYFLFSRLYLSHKWIDTPLHYFGGFFITMFLVDYLELSNHQRRLKQIFILTSAAIFVGVFWEFFEYIMSRLFDGYAAAFLGNGVSLIGNLDDTILDLAMDFLGALTYTIFAFKFTSSRVETNPLSPDLSSEPARQP